MKSLSSFFARLTFVLCLLAALGASAQRQSSRNSLPQTGYWVVETAAHKADGSTIRFYSDDNQLIYEEHLDGQRLDVKRTRTVASLNRALDKAVIHWLATHQVKTNGTWVAELRK